MGHYNSFIVRIWNDKSENLIRGYIQHVGTEEVVHFINWDKMVNFIINHLDLPIGEQVHDQNKQLLELERDE
jgi:hypothetical protein